jgi:hypothetical protein
MGEAKRKRDALQIVIAYHEAGHAVVARTLGLRINDIRLASRDNYVQTHSEGWVTKDGTAEERIVAYEKDAKTAMAGMIAQHQVRQLRQDDVRHQTDDIAIIWSQVASIALLRSGEPLPDLAPGEKGKVALTDETAQAAMLVASRLWAETQSMVKASWGAIERVAALMLHQDRTTQADVDCAMQSAGGPIAAAFNELPFASFVSGSGVWVGDDEQRTT